MVALQLAEIWFPYAFLFLCFFIFRRIRKRLHLTVFSPCNSRSFGCARTRSPNELQIRRFHCLVSSLVNVVLVSSPFCAFAISISPLCSRRHLCRSRACLSLAAALAEVCAMRGALSACTAASPADRIPSAEKLRPRNGDGDKVSVHGRTAKSVRWIKCFVWLCSVHAIVGRIRVFPTMFSLRSPRGRHLVRGHELKKGQRRKVARRAAATHVCIICRSTLGDTRSIRRAQEAAECRSSCSATPFSIIAAPSCALFFFSLVCYLLNSFYASLLLATSMYSLSCYCFSRSPVLCARCSVLYDIASDTVNLQTIHN